MEDKTKSNIKRTLNIASPIASALALVNPAFLAIPIIASVANELFAYFDSKSVESRLNRLQLEIEKQGIGMSVFAEKVSGLDEHDQYVVRNIVKHLCLSAQPEVTDALNKAIVELIMGETYGMAEHVCEILQQCNADDMYLLQLIKHFQIYGDKSTYKEKLLEAEKAKDGQGIQDRSYFHGESNTIFWNDFAKSLSLAPSITDMSLFLNRKFAIKDKDGTMGDEIISFAYIARSIIKMQNLGVLQCDFITTAGTTSMNHIDRFHITFFGNKLLEYIEIDSNTENE